jgi:glycine betaine/proline transport system substrate-binding protein
MTYRMLRFAAASAWLCVVSAPSVAANVPESSDTIKFVLLDWTGNHLTNHIAGEILSRMGYKVDYAVTVQAAAWQGMSEGSLHVNAEQWLVTQKAVFDDLKAKGKVDSLGELGLVGREAWYYPAYIEEKCPGLPAWEALAKCTDLFATAETAPKGRLVDFPAEWTPESPKWIDAFGFNLVAIPAGGEGAAIAEMKSATARKEPLLIMFNEPHWAVREYGLKAVELPAFDPACVTDPSWGVNKEKLNDCYEAAPLILKVTWSGFEEKWPAAAKVIQQITFTNEEQEPLTRKVDVDHQKVEAVAKEWVDDNAAKWQPWVDAATK